jgi:hypothetical protein
LRRSGAKAIRPPFFFSADFTHAFTKKGTAKTRRTLRTEQGQRKSLCSLRLSGENLFFSRILPMGIDSFLGVLCDLAVNYFKGVGNGKL